MPSLHPDNTPQDSSGGIVNLSFCARQTRPPLPPLSTAAAMRRGAHDEQQTPQQQQSQLPLQSSASKRVSPSDTHDDDRPDHAGSASAGSSSTKRRRVGLACNTCRTRKSRCDGQRPLCTPCLSLGVECQYDQGDSVSHAVARKDTVLALEQRVAFVEDHLRRVNDVLKGHLTPCAGAGLNTTTTTTTNNNSAPSQLLRHDHHHHTGGFPTGAQGSSSLGLEEPWDEDASTNGMAMTFIEEPSAAIFGQSSNIHFTQTLLRALATVHKSSPQLSAALDRHTSLSPGITVGVSQDLPPASAATASSSGTRSHRPQNDPWHDRRRRHGQDPAAITALPSTTEIESLLDSYFATAGSVFPIIHEPSFRATYLECRRNGFTQARRTWLGLLNIMLATASCFDTDSIPSAVQRQDKASVFYNRAQELCGDLSRRVISLEMVHYLFLVVILCQGTQRSVQAWNTHGLVIRSAIALGLHSDMPSRRRDPIQDESRRRTWSVIYCLDQVLGAAFGRPTSIPDKQLQRREVVSNGSPSSASHGVNFPHASGRIDLNGEFLAMSLKLYQIMGRSLADQYGSNLDNTESPLDDVDSFKASGELRKALQQWVADLPPYLQLIEPNSPLLSQSTPEHRARTILTMRYHNLAILIHKPLLSTTLRHLFPPKNADHASKSMPYLTQLAIVEAHECILAAQNTIDMIHAIITNDQSGKNNLGVWYYTLYYGEQRNLFLLLMLCIRC